MKGYITRGRLKGTWYLRVELTRSADGKRRQRRETIRNTKDKAENRLRFLLTAIDAIERAKISLEEIERHGSQDRTRV